MTFHKCYVYICMSCPNLALYFQCHVCTVHFARSHMYLRYVVIVVCFEHPIMMVIPSLSYSIHTNHHQIICDHQFI